METGWGEFTEKELRHLVERTGSVVETLEGAGKQPMFVPNDPSHEFRRQQAQLNAIALMWAYHDLALLLDRMHAMVVRGQTEAEGESKGEY